MSLAVAIIGPIIAIFGIIILHELGHFVVARACSIKILRFSIGFGKALWRWKSKSGSEYVLAMLPLGGYVKMLGEGEEATTSKDARRAYNQKPLLVRMMVVFAGPFTNLLLAIIAFWGVYLMGVTHTRPVIGRVIPHSIAAQAGVKVGDELIQIDKIPVKNWQQALMATIKRMGDHSKMELKVKPLYSDRLEAHEMDLSTWMLDRRSPDVFKSLGLTPYQPKVPPVVVSIAKDSPAEKAKLQLGDRIVAINGQPIKDWLQIVNIVHNKPNKEIQLTIMRDHEVRRIPLKVARMKEDGKALGYLGILSRLPQWLPHFTYQEKYTVLSAWLPAVEQSWRLFTFNLIVMAKMVIGKVSIHTLRGPITVFQAAGKATQAGLKAYLEFIGFINLTIGFINLLPIPGLDGGHLLFQVIEGLFRRPVPERIQLIALTIGMIFLIFLMLQATINDLVCLFFSS
ncbi:RIP metalloprotease RseP [Coxiella endosymbiont of Ornithodoros amblus]|uniref:RIP metalloprotease RseP n=1 Tax=Coxiella endosymbiont of Ornithodoros amblus TaxID=1656166 RepID=UPI00244E05E6|nr:RIP metalloprotease RseP [Coxiella endosymbiont of Ornithodoros amblus]MBW5802987.1 RIP metalloprotease RseP [Coxiella endosymbiont of Ornithodoros amblus]